MSLLRLARKPPATVSPDASVMEAVRLMCDERIGAVAVTEGKKLIGIFTERDLMRKLVLEERDPKAVKVREVMTTELTTATDAMSASAALQEMSVKRIRHMPVVNAEGEVEGMVSLRFLLHDRMENLMDELQSLEAYVAADGPGG